MKKDKKGKAKKSLSMLLVMAISLVFGVAIGFLLVSRNDGESLSPRVMLITLAIMLLMVYSAMIIQIILHELGHLIFGLLSGYRFQSFRIFGIMLNKEDGRLRLRRLSLLGTAGQCLMAPPDMKDGKMPILLYNFGGVIMNVLTAIAFLALSLVFSDVAIFSTWMRLLSLCGLLFALTNGIPARAATVNNDGYNAIEAKKSAEAMRALWIQLKVNELAAGGVRLKDMPEEWFAVPSDEQMKNGLVATLGVIACNRLFDECRFDEADRLMEHILNIKSSMAGIYRNLITCDRIYIELITECRREVIDVMMNAEQKRFMKGMRRFISVLRTEYAYSLLLSKDEERARKLKVAFEKCAKRHPSKSDVESERELVLIAEERSLQS